MRLAPGDWQTYRAVRLAMLQESPAAFGSTLAEAARNEERHWRQRLRDNVVFLARVGGAPAGLRDLLDHHQGRQPRRLRSVRNVG